MSNDEVEGIITIVKSLDHSGSLLEGVSETIQNEVKDQKWGFHSILLGTLGASLLGNMLAGKGKQLGKDSLELPMDPKDLQSRNFNATSSFN